MPNNKNIEDNLSGIPSRVPDLRPGKYKDGTPLHEVKRWVGAKELLTEAGETQRDPGAAP